MCVRLVLTDKHCRCESPPCECTQELRGYTCEHMIQGEYIEEQRKLGIFKGWKMEPCGMAGTLQDDCNYFFDSKMVLCDRHVKQHRADAQRLCGICRTPKAECCC
jgi:hypothetical protein